MKKKLENKILFPQENISSWKRFDHNFLKKTNFTSLFKRTLYPLNKSYIDLSGSNNLKGEDYESNRAKTERFYIKPIFARENFHKSPSS